MEKKLPKIYPADYNSLIVQDLLSAYYQILSIIFLKGFISVKMDSKIKNVKLV